MKLRNIFMTLALTASLGASASAPRYVFYFIGDGMGVGQVMSSQTYNRVALGNDTPLLMLQFPVAGMIETYSASSTVTDSAAAGTALATGNKTNNGMLGVTPDTVAVTSMAEILHNAGWGVGLVTNVAPDDATPGAFYAHVPARWQTYDIGRQAAESGYEFIAGSTWRGANDSKGTPTDLLDYIASHGIDQVNTTADVAASNKRRVFLTSANPFSESNIGYTIDSIPGALSLPDMTQACINHLTKVSPERFFMMVEGGNIDHAGHGNDGGTVAVEVINFNQALQHAYDFYMQHPDETVIIVTADHETGGMSVGNRNVGYWSNTQYVPFQNMSKERFSREFNSWLRANPGATWPQVKDYIAGATGLWNHIEVSDKQNTSLKALYEAMSNNSRNIEDEKSLYASFSAISAEVFRVLNDNQGFGWTTGSHSGNPVPVYAIGNGMERFGRLLDNTRVAPMLLELTEVQQ